MHRAYHAVPQTMNAPRRAFPTNAVFGFIAMLLKFIDIASPDALICAFDAGRPAFRMEALEQYKSQRPPMDDDLKVQFPIIEELLEAMNAPVVRIKGWEGDDVNGTIAARDEELGYETLLVTGDKDAYQLATDMTRIVTTKKGITDVAIYGPAEVLERYGVRPDQFIDFLGLKGDSVRQHPRRARHRRQDRGEAAADLRQPGGHLRACGRPQGQAEREDRRQQGHGILEPRRGHHRARPRLPARPLKYARSPCSISER